MTDLRFLDPTGLVNRAAFNERLEQLNSAAFVGTDGLVDINGDEVGTRVYAGSYTGTGTGTVTLTFPFNPGLVIVGFNPTSNSYQYQLVLTPAMSGLRANTLELSNNGSNTRRQAYSLMVEVVSFSGNSVTFGRPEYTASSNPGILNDSGTNYWFIAIG